MIYSKAKLDEYASPLSDTEKEQCQNAIDMVKEALVNYGYVIKTQRNNYSEEGYAYYYELRDTSYSTITILLQGSYANNTNIKRYSDVDVSVIYSPIIPLSLDKSFMKFKEDIYNALVKKFGSDVERKNKSICVSGNTYRKSIDVVPAFSITNNLLDGIQFLTDKGEKIINYPLKQILNENKKNKDTGYKFKRYVRIIKNIKEEALRQKLIYKNGYRIYDDSYNSSPEAVSANLKMLSEKNENNSALLGDMLELGEKSAFLHRFIGQECARYNIKKLYLIMLWYL